MCVICFCLVSIPAEMSFVDMAYLHKEDLSEGILSYKRKKTGQLLHIRWERCMENIVKKYSWNHTVYLLPILKDNGVDERRQYKNAITLMNRRLKDIGRMVGLTHPLTMHCARIHGPVWQNINVFLCLSSAKAWDMIPKERP